MPPRVVTARSIELQVRANQLTRIGPSGPSSATQHEDDEFVVFINAAQDLVPAADDGLTAPDAIEREGAFEPERLALPEADPGVRRRPQ